MRLQDIRSRCGPVRSLNSGGIDVGAMEHGNGAEPARGFAAGGRARHPPTPRRCSAGRLRGLHRPTSGRPRRWQLRRRRRSYRRRAPGLCQRLPSSAEMIGTLLGRMPCRGCIRRGAQPVVQHVGVIQTHRREHLREGPINRGHSPRLLRILIPVLETAALLCGILDLWGAEGLRSVSGGEQGIEGRAEQCIAPSTASPRQHWRSTRARR